MQWTISRIFVLLEIDTTYQGYYRVTVVSPFSLYLLPFQDLLSDYDLSDFCSSFAHTYLIFLSFVRKDVLKYCVFRENRPLQGHSWLRQLKCHMCCLRWTS